MAAAILGGGMAAVNRQACATKRVSLQLDAGGQHRLPRRGWIRRRADIMATKLE